MPTPTPTDTTTSAEIQPSQTSTSLFPNNYVPSSFYDRSSRNLLSIPTTYTRNVDTSQPVGLPYYPTAPAPTQQQATITFEPSSSATTIITFSQVSAEDPNKDAVVNDPTGSYPYTSLYTTQPTAQQLLPYLSTNYNEGSSSRNILDANMSPLITSGGGTYYTSSTPQSVNPGV
jgi:hypothetical protein